MTQNTPYFEKSTSYKVSFAHMSMQTTRTMTVQKPHFKDHSEPYISHPPLPHLKQGKRGNPPISACLPSARRPQIKYAVHPRCMKIKLFFFFLIPSIHPSVLLALPVRSLHVRLAPERNSSSKRERKRKSKVHVLPSLTQS